jgi:hypothetical protein
MIYFALTWSLSLTKEAAGGCCRVVLVVPQPPSASAPAPRARISLDLAIRASKVPLHRPAAAPAALAAGGLSAELALLWMEEVNLR